MSRDSCQLCPETRTLPPLPGKRPSGRLWAVYVGFGSASHRLPHGCHLSRWPGLPARAIAASHPPCSVMSRPAAGAL